MINELKIISRQSKTTQAKPCINATTVYYLCHEIKRFILFRRIAPEIADVMEARNWDQ